MLSVFFLFSKTLSVKVKDDLLISIVVPCGFFISIVITKYFILHYRISPPNFYIKNVPEGAKLNILYFHVAFVFYKCSYSFVIFPFIKWNK